MRHEFSEHLLGRCISIIRTRTCDCKLFGDSELLSLEKMVKAFKPSNCPRVCGIDGNIFVAVGVPSTYILNLQANTASVAIRGLFG